MKKGMERVAVYPIEAVLPFVFTREVRHRLVTAGYDYSSEQWKAAGSRKYPILVKNRVRLVRIPMGSHRYELFATKGIRCVQCGVTGVFFALERGLKNAPGKYHFNLYGFDAKGREVLITKDHVVPRAKGGKNTLSNYQTMCQVCNQRKGDKLP